jgi:DNA-binding transcriptional LysR family regulator
MRNAVTLDALRVLDAIHSKGSFAAAAQALYKVPSALTYTMQKLESDLGVILFDRKGQRASLTAAGKLVLQEGNDILLATRRLEEKVLQLETGWEPKLVIAKDTIIPEAPLFDLIGQFCQSDKQVEITVIEEVLGGGWDALYTERADIAIGVGDDLPSGQFITKQMAMVEFVFAVSTTHPLADFIGLLESSHISQYPTIVAADSSRSLPGRSSGLINSKQQIRVSSMASKLQAQLQGIGVGFLPLHMALPYLNSGQLVAKSCAIPRPPIPLYLAWRKNKDGKAMQWFCDKLQQQQWFA